MAEYILWPVETTLARNKFVGGAAFQVCVDHAHIARQGKAVASSIGFNSGGPMV